MVKFEQERVAWEADLRKMHEILEYRNKDIEMAHSHIEKLQRAIYGYQETEAKALEYEDRIQLLSQELEKMTEILGRKAAEIKELDSLKTFNKNLEIKNQKLVEEIEQWKQRTSKMELSVKEIQSIEANYIEYESKISNLLTEIDILKGKLRGYVNNNNNYAENAKLKDYENKIAMVSVELERLTQLSNKKIEENDALKQKCNKLEVTVTEFRVNEGKLQQRNRVLEEEIEKIRKNLKI